jgi:hypothetical protein
MHRRSVIRVSEGEQWLDFWRLDSEFFADFATSTGVVRFARGKYTADSDIPVRGEHIFRRSTKVNEQLASAVENQNVCTAVRQTFYTHLCPSDDAQRAAQLIHYIYELARSVQFHVGFQFDSFVIQNASIPAAL